MTIRVSTPSGANIEFPDGTDAATISGVMAHLHGQTPDMPGQGADAAIDPTKPGMPQGQAGESPIVERAAQLPIAYDATGRAHFGWPQMAVDAKHALGRLGRAAESALGIGGEHSPAETFPQPQDAVLAFATDAPLQFRGPSPAPIARNLPPSQRVATMAEDMAAHERSGVPVFAPSFGKTPTKMVAKGLSEMYGIGAPLQSALEDTYGGMAARASDVANSLAPNATYDAAGTALQQGLDRYKTSGVRDLDPGIIAQHGENPYATVNPKAVMSKGAAERVVEAEPIREYLNAGGKAETARGVETPTSKLFSERKIERRPIEDFGDAELDNLIRSPSDQTSFGARAEALYEHADRQLPKQMRINETANPQLVAAINTKKTAQALAAHEAASTIPGGVVGGRYADLAERVKTNLQLPQLKEMRTAVGRDLGNFSYGETGLDRRQLSALYSSLSKDQEIAYQDLANRAHIQSQVSPNRPDYISPADARKADAALYEFRRANRYFKQGVQRIDTFLSVIKAAKPEAAAQKMIAAATEGGKGDIRMFTNAMSALRPEERAQFMSLVVREMGKPVASARGIAQDVGFSPQSFATRYTKMDPRARAWLPKEVGDLMTIANRMANVERFENVSGSGRMSMNVGGLLAAIPALVTGKIVPLAATAAGGLGVSAMLSSPRYARWLVNYARLKSSGANSEKVLRSAIRELGNFAARDPSLAPIYRSVLMENGVGSDTGKDAQRNQSPEPPRAY